MEKEKVSPERFVAMQAGNAELQSRLLDLIRAGLVELDLAPAQSRPVRDGAMATYLDEFAARMVDAQLGSMRNVSVLGHLFVNNFRIHGMKKY